MNNKYLFLKSAFPTLSPTVLVFSSSPSYPSTLWPPPPPAASPKIIHPAACCALNFHLISNSAVLSPRSTPPPLQRKLLAMMDGIGLSSPESFRKISENFGFRPTRTYGGCTCYSIYISPSLYFLLFALLNLTIISALSYTSCLSFFSEAKLREVLCACGLENITRGTMALNLVLLRNSFFRCGFCFLFCFFFCMG